MAQRGTQLRQAKVKPSAGATPAPILRARLGQGRAADSPVGASPGRAANGRSGATDARRARRRPGHAVARAIRSVDRELIMVVMPGMETEKAGDKLGLPPVREIYADRAYADNGNLVSRKPRLAG